MAGFNPSQVRAGNGRWTRSVTSQGSAGALRGMTQIKREPKVRFQGSREVVGSLKGLSGSVKTGLREVRQAARATEGKRRHKITAAAKEALNQGWTINAKHITPAQQAYYERTPLGRVHAVYSRDRLPNLVPPGSVRDLGVRIAAPIGGIVAAAGLVGLGLPVAGAIVGGIVTPGLLGSALNVVDWGVTNYRRRTGTLPPPPPPLRQRLRRKR